MSWLAVFGVLGGTIALLSNVPYIVDTIKGKTKPHRVTWFVLVVLNITFVANQIGSGASNTLWLAISFLVSTIIISALSIKKGVGGGTKMDYLILLGSVVGVLLWVMFNSPVASTISNLTVASLAFVPTILKSWKAPETETNIKWLLGAVGAGFTVISIGEVDIPLLLLPLYSFILNFGIWLILIKGNIKKALKT